MLTDKSKKITFILSLAGKSSSEVCEYCDLLPDILKEMGCFEYACAPHCLDVLPDGTLKTFHIHCSACFADTRRLSTYVNMLAEKLRVSTEAISIQKLRDLGGAIRYLVHRDDPDKYQYNPDIIRTSLPSDEVQTILDSERQTEADIHYDDLLYYCSKVKHMGEIARFIGASRFVHYYRLIACAWDDYLNGVRG